MDNRPIGMFDSGIGGLTVLKEYVKLMPNEDFIYYADTANLPYGNKTKKEIIEYSKKIVEYLIGKDVKAIVIACGTASSLAYAYLKENYDFPIFNIIEPTIQYLNNKNIGIIATQGSVSSHVWENEIHKLYPESKIILQACPKLVPLAEKGLINSLDAKNAINEYLSIFKKENVECLILGCTHYPLFLPLIKDELDKNITILNPRKIFG